MATIQLEESALLNSYVHEMGKRFGGFIDPKNVIKTYKALVVSATSFLATVKTTKTPVAFTVEDNEGNLIIAAVVEYNEAPEVEDDVTGNWNYFWTFDKNDIPENTTCYDVKQKQTHEPIFKAAWEFCSAKFEGTEAMINLFIMSFSLLKDYMLDGAVEGDTYELVYPGVFKAQSAVENGEKVVSFVPDGLIKKMIKDDEALEKAKK